jgi:hypothetical protein
MSDGIYFLIEKEGVRDKELFFIARGRSLKKYALELGMKMISQKFI